MWRIFNELLYLMRNILAVVISCVAVFVLIFLHFVPVKIRTENKILNAVVYYENVFYIFSILLYKSQLDLMIRESLFDSPIFSCSLNLLVHKTLKNLYVWVCFCNNQWIKLLILVWTILKLKLSFIVSFYKRSFISTRSTLLNILIFILMGV